MHAYHKLHPKYYGPFEVLEKVRAMAYKIKFPLGSKIHHVFHMSFFKKHLGARVEPLPLLPLVIDDGLLTQEPKAVLKRRIYQKGSAARV